MSFAYTAKDAVGNVRKGVMTAADEQEFLAKIREKGMYVTEYKERQTNTKTLKKFKTRLMMPMMQSWTLPIRFRNLKIFGAIHLLILKIVFMMHLLNLISK